MTTLGNRPLCVECNLNWIRPSKLEEGGTLCLECDFKRARHEQSLRDFEKELNA